MIPQCPRLTVRGPLALHSYRAARRTVAAMSSSKGQIIHDAGEAYKVRSNLLEVEVLAGRTGQLLELAHVLGGSLWIHLQIAAKAKKVAVLGIKTESQAGQPAYYVPEYLHSRGVDIIPVPGKSRRLCARYALSNRGKEANAVYHTHQPA